MLEDNETVFHGHGALFNEKEGYKYLGTFINGQKSGNGVQTYMANNNTYEGEWLGDMKHGKGVFSYTDGSSYQGLFFKNEKESGVLEMANGNEYAGGFKDDLFDGYSLLKYSNGDQYCGDFLNGKRNG